MTENELHISIAGFLQRALRPPAWFTTFPAGGGGQQRGRELKQKGMKAGVPDIFPIIYQGSVYGFEIKLENGRLSAVQERCHAELIDAKCKIAVVRSLDDVKTQLNKWRIPWSTESKSTEDLRLAIERWNKEHQTTEDSHDVWRRLNKGNR